MQNIDAESGAADSFQVLITGIKWNTESGKRSYGRKHTNAEPEDGELPEQFSLNIPDNVLNSAKKGKNSLNDAIETFVYNWLTHEFSYEVTSCSIWLPMEEDEAGE